MRSTPFFRIVPITVAVLAFGVVPASAEIDGEGDDCLCCWEDFNPWPLKEHSALDVSLESCLFMDGDAWVAYGHGPHELPEEGSCENGTLHGLCNEQLIAAVALARTGNTEPLVSMAADEASVRLSHDGEGIDVLSCDEDRVIAWLPLSDPAPSINRSSGRVAASVSE